MKINFTLIIVLFLTISTFISCTVEPQEINYGHDHCHLCDMTVVDKTHAAQYVTSKGKVYMFDAVECLVRQINKDNNKSNLAFILVADFSHPGKLMDAKTSFYLISEKIKSPMGANLSAFDSEETAKKAQSMYSGKVYSWEEIKKELK